MGAVAVAALDPQVVAGGFVDQHGGGGEVNIEIAFGPASHRADDAVVVAAIGLGLGFEHQLLPQLNAIDLLLFPLGMRRQGAEGKGCQQVLGA